MYFDFYQDKKGALFSLVVSTPAFNAWGYRFKFRKGLQNLNNGLGPLSFKQCVKERNAEGIDIKKNMVIGIGQILLSKVVQTFF